MTGMFTLEKVNEISGAKTRRGRKEDERSNEWREEAAKERIFSSIVLLSFSFTQEISPETPKLWNLNLNSEKANLA